MKKFAFCILIIIILSENSINCFIRRYNPYPYFPPSKRQIFGDLTSDRIGYQHETRFGFPFFTREAIIVFPSVCIICIFNQIVE